MQDESLALHIHWNLYLEKSNNENDQKEKKYFKKFYKELMAELKEKQPDLHEQLMETIEFRNKLKECSDHIKSLNIRVAAKTDCLQAELKGPGKLNMEKFEKPLTCPLDPTIKLYGADPEKCCVFRSIV